MKPPRPQNAIAHNAFMRWDAVDALRGLAMVWMTVFHFCFDLNHFGYIRQNFYDDPVWTWQRTCILSLFLFTAGLGQAIAVGQGQSWPKFWRRWAQVAGCALLVTAASWWMYPKSFIYFGTLHGMAALIILVRLWAVWGRWRNLLWLLGALAIAFKFVAVYAISTSGNADLASTLNSPAWNWLGLNTVKPVTEDYVPLLPWLGVMCWGMAAGQWLLAKRSAWLAWQPARGKSGGAAVGTLAATGFSQLALLGRWSLLYYMVHQPVMIGLLSAWKWCAG